ncbi:MAG: cytochrome c family protein [Novosphingobium sp.]|nr:cytochrome c family protein [Novosphingobium sp.]
MEDRFNTTAGWTLFSGIVALGLSSLSGMYFGANKHERPEKMGYEIEGVVSSDGGESAEPLPNLLAKADLAKGEQVFKKCASCHTANQGGANGIGPNLFGMMGEGIATGHPGFAFSDALKSVGGKWDFATMDAWIHSPKKFAPGTKMTFAGLSNPEERANLLVYMNSLGSNLPLPAPVEVAAAAPAGDAGAAPSDAAAAGAPAGEAAAAPSAAESEAPQP